MRRVIMLVVGLAFFLISVPAHAHFEMIHNKNSVVKLGKITAPHNALHAQFVRSDENGVFIDAIPRAGWWGFNAVGASGKGLSHNGKKLRQDAVMWVQAFDMN